MKCKVVRDNLLRGLKLVEGAVSKRATLPVLSHVMLAAGEDGLTLRANNLELMLEVAVAADVEEVGATCLPYRLLTDVVQALTPVDDDVVSFELSDEARKRDTSIITHGTAVVELAGIDGEEMPIQTLVETDDVAVHSLAAAWLVEAFGSVAFATPADDTRPTLKAVSWVSENGRSEMAATDGFRLAYRQEESPVEGALNLLLAAYQMEPLLKAIKETGETAVTMMVNCQVVKFTAGPVTGYVRQVDGKYPDFKPIIPPQWKMGLEMDKASVLQAARLAEVIARNEGSHDRAVKLVLSGAVLSISAVSTNQNSAKCAPVMLEGKQIGDVGMNCQFLIDGLEHVAGDRVLMQFTDPSEPIVIRSDADSNWICVVMPVFLGRR